MTTEVAVVGAGVVGLSSAVAIQERCPRAKVTIIADKFDRHTTSDGSGGLFVPMAVGADEERYHLWASEGAKHFFDLAFSSQCGSAGINLITGYELLYTDKYPAFLKYALHASKIGQRVLKYFPGYKYGYQYTTVIVEGPKYLPWLMNRFVQGGGRVVRKKLESFEELSGQYDVVINCSGLGSMQLTSDPHIEPLRGHLLRISAPWIKHFVHSEDNRYILPASETIALGGNRQPGRTDTAPVQEESRAFWEDFRKTYPSLEGAKFLWDWVGLRPYRNKVRVEPEVMTFKGKPLKVIHNYGHGHFGVSLSWGTAVDVAQMVQAMGRDKARL